MRYYHYNSPYTAQEKLKALKLWERSTTEFVCHRYHCSDRSLRRWRSIYDGTLTSLENGSHVPHTPHPNEQTAEEKKWICDLVRRNPGAGLNELYGKLQLHHGYKRNPVTLYKYLKKIGFYDNAVKKKQYTPKPYDTPLYVGEKWQLDVKFVPFSCRTKAVLSDRNFFQYTVIDEASRERFIYPYEELTALNTVDFLWKAFIYFGYKPKMIQTDNGSEFTYTRETKTDKLHPLDRLCADLGIVHKLIKPRTPRHNGKVERSHRNDNERFYSKLKFYSYADLVHQMQLYLRRSNNIPSRVLKSVDGRQIWMTPVQKRKELEGLGYCIA